MASLLAINSGGLFALADLTTVNSDLRATAAISFVVGILSALAIAWLGQIASRKFLIPMNEMTAFWMVVAASGHFDEEEHAAIVGRIQKAVTYGTRCRWAGWLSVAAFLLACGSILMGTPSQQPSLANIESKK
jgi:hypothetical protein